MAVYFVFVLGIGAVLKRYTRTSTDFFLAGRAIPAWVCGLALLSANLGAQEVMGMAASGAKYGIATSHFYWITSDLWASISICFGGWFCWYLGWECFCSVGGVLCRWTWKKPPTCLHLRNQKKDAAHP